MRPRSDRPTIIGLRESRPRLVNGRADEPLDVAGLSSLAEAGGAFAVEDARAGRFLVIAERRGRGPARYWVARAYAAGIRASAYVGPVLSEASLLAAADTLAARLPVTPARPVTATTGPLAGLRAARAALLASASEDPATQTALVTLDRLIADQPD